MIKVKSVSDVITNSSTEVWTIKTPILEEAREKFGDEESAWREVWGKKENLYQSFIDFPDLDSILKAWETGKGKFAISCFIPRKLRYLLDPYQLTSKEIMILKKFGHTQEELKDFEDKVNQERIAKIQEIRDDFKEYYGWSVAAFGSHSFMWHGFEGGKKLLGWLKENYTRGKDWDYDY